MSDNYPLDGLLKVPFNVLSTPDVYVLITDDFDKVSNAAESANIIIIVIKRI